MQRKTNWYVITGGLSSGKITTVNLHKERGYITTFEPARHSLDTQHLKGKTTEDVLPLDYRPNSLQISPIKT
ncbi:hypothetical protein [Daejeonella sp.]|uniref:hypothetical protein n=1 Tax=Daejeonella sp. TaxID=2805397 RepID=UPI003983AF56